MAMTIEQLIDDLKAKHQRWGMLVNEPVPSTRVIEIIGHFETKLDAALKQMMDDDGDCQQTIEQLRGELTTANRRLAAANARETKLKNEIKALKDESRTDTNNSEV